MIKNGMRPVHPGEVLREDFLIPLGLSANALAKALHVPAPRIDDILRERRGVSADTAMRLVRYFGGDARSWLNLQSAYDLRVAEIENAKRIEREIAPATTRTHKQAVRIPREFQFDTDAVDIERRRDEIVLRRPVHNLRAAFDALAALPVDFFAEGREDSLPQSGDGL